MLKKRIPTILGILLLLFGITAGVYLVELGSQPVMTRASPELIPLNVRITNISDSLFSVSWRTEAAMLGFLRYGGEQTSLQLSAFDDRNGGDSSERSYFTHHVTVSGLSPETTYYFVILSGNDSTNFDDGGKPYSVVTGRELEPSMAADTSYGSVYYPDLSPTEGSIVYVNMSGSASLSSLVSSSGTWAVPLSSLRSADLSSFLSYDPSEALISIEAVGPDGSVATAVTKTSNDDPVDDMVLGQSYDFSKATPEDGSGEEKSIESQFSFEPLGETSSTGTEYITLENVSEGESVNTQNPEFLGGGPPGTSIEILLESEPIQANVVIGESGSWSWSPPSSMTPGEHSITLKWVDSLGISRVLVRRFVVLAQGESMLPAFESTPSATTTPTPITTGAPTPTPTGVGPSPTASPTAIPKLSPTPIQATGPALPEPGTGWLSVFIALFGLTLVVSGFALYFNKQEISSFN